MPVKLAVIMDPISKISYKKDSTLAMLTAAQTRGWSLSYFEQKDVFLLQGNAFGHARNLTILSGDNPWFKLGDYETQPLQTYDVILMRKDPPFDLQYIYTTYILEKAESKGVLIINKPQSLRDANEKLFTMWFPECCPNTLVTRDIHDLRRFFLKYEDIVCKPLDAMGGSSVFRVKRGDQNASVIFELLTHHGTSFTMAQQFIPEISAGDKRIILIDGEPIPYALARIPAEGELRGNLVAGAKGVAVELSARDRFICEAVAGTLRQKGLVFVGLDVIGDYLTEINVTSPTGIRELDAACQLDISEIFCNKIANLLRKT